MPHGKISETHHTGKPHFLMRLFAAGAAMLLYREAPIILEPARGVDALLLPIHPQGFSEKPLEAAAEAATLAPAIVVPTLLPTCPAEQGDFLTSKAGFFSEWRKHFSENREVENHGQVYEPPTPG